MRQHECEFVSTKSREHVAWPRLPLQDLGYRAQQLVAGEMTAGIVHDFELIEVQEDKRMRDVSVA
jgi:hypothetical protein